MTDKKFRPSFLSRQILGPAQKPAVIGWFEKTGLIKSERLAWNILLLVIIFSCTAAFVIFTKTNQKSTNGASSFYLGYPTNIARPDVSR